MEPWDALFAELPDYMVEQALEHLQQVDVGGGEQLIAQGDEDAALVYLLAGQVVIRRGGVQIDVSGPGEVVGEMAVFRPGARVAEVLTTEPTRALILDRAGYEALVQANNPAIFHLERLVLRQLGQRLRRLDGLIARMSAGEPDPYAPPRKGLLARIRELFVPAKPPELVDRMLNAIEVLEASHLFREERYTVLEGMQQYFEHYVFAPGEPLCLHGETGDAIYLVGEGRADVFVDLPGTGPDRIHKLGSVGPGAVVGMTSLVDGRPRMATVLAITQVDALQMPLATFRGLVEREGQIPSAFRRAVIRAFAEQVDEAGRNLVALSAPVPPYLGANAATEVYSQ